MLFMGGDKLYFHVFTFRESLLVKPTNVWSVKPGCSQKSIFRSGEWFSKALKSVGRVSRAILGA